MKSRILKKCHLLKCTSFLLLWLAVTHVFAQITISVQNESLREVLQEIERASDYRFFFNETLPGLDQTTSIRLTDASIETTMQQLLANTNIEYRKSSDNVIALVARTAVAQPQPTSVAATAQQATTRSITGTVIDVSNQPIIGATVVERDNPSNGTITDFNGNFTLNVAPNATLLVSFIGFDTQEVPTAGQTSVRIVLSEDTQFLEELVVVGYTVRRRESLTGALSTVSGDQLRTITSATVENMLVSQAPGVHVAPGSSQPGARGAVMIRGRSTLHGNTAPLWVIDGVIVGHEAPHSLNPADIESITVLKDAASTAIYGSQGANGVIVVTTRTPRTGELSISFTTRAGLSYANRGNFHPMTGAELFDLWNSFINPEALTMPLWGPELRDRNFDWWDYATQAGVTQEYNLSISGGSDQLRSMISVGMHDETGVVRGYHFRRYNFQHRTIYRPTNWLTVTPIVSGSRREIDSRQHSVAAMYANFPWDSPYDADGNLVPHRPGNSVWMGGDRTNYLIDVDRNFSLSTQHDFSGSLNFDIRLNSWLTFASTNNFRWVNTTSHSVTDPRSFSGENIGGAGISGQITDSRNEVARRTTTQMLRANKLINDVHAINGLIAYEFSDSRTRTLSATGRGFLPGFQVLNMVTLPHAMSGNISAWAMQSVFMDVHYAFDNRYLLQLSARRDGASNFGARNRYGNFGSISGGWNIHREEFFNIHAFDALRLRASYGTTGMRPNALHPSYDLYTAVAGAGYEGQSGIRLSQLGNPFMTWESALNTGIGIDMSLFDRVRLTMDYYDRTTRGLLFPIPVPGVIGVTTIWQNVGKIRNRGLEATLGVDIIRNSELHWTFNKNIGLNRNKIMRLPGIRDENGNVPHILTGSGIGIAGSGQRVWREGQPADTWWMPEWAGVDPETGAPQWYRIVTDADGNTTREITTNHGQATATEVGTMMPKFFGGFSTALTWRQFDLNMVFGYSVGGQIVNYSRLEFDSDGAYVNRNQMRPLPGWTRWQQPGDIATHPVARFSNNSGSNRMSSRWLEDGSFLKMRSLSMGYNFALPQYHLSNIRLFLTGENLFTLTNYSGVDPELPASGGNIIGVTGPSVYPTARRFMLGVNLTF